MRLRLAWGSHDTEIEAVRPPLAAHRAATPTPLDDPAAAVRAALEQPLDYPPLRRALTPDDHVTIVLDETLPHLPRLLVPILEQLQEAGIAAAAITLLCQAHAGAQRWVDDLPDAFQDVRIEVHQPADRKALAYLATTKLGKRVYLNRSAVDADQLILLTGWRYDPILGYAGGATALYPSLSDEPTLHEAAAKLETKAPGKNPWPLRQEAAEVAWLLGAPFLVQIIEGEADTITQVVAGPPESGAAGVRLLDQCWRVEVERPADVVIAPLTGDPRRLQAVDLARAFFAAARVVQQGGAIVVLTAAVPALGPAFDLLRHREDPEAALSALLHEKPTDPVAAFMWASAASRAKLYLLSGLPADTVEELFAVPLEDARQVERLLTPAASYVVLPDAHKTLAVLPKEARG